MTNNPMPNEPNEKQDVFNWDAPVNADTNDNWDTPEDIANAEANLRANAVVIGYVYNPERTTNKRTGELIRKKPSYRLIKQQSYQLTNPFHIVALHEHLSAYREQRKNVAVFVSPELWSYHDENAVKVTKYYWTSNGVWESYSHIDYMDMITSPNPEQYSTGNNDSDELSCDQSSVTPLEPCISSEPVRVSTGVTLWRRFVNWLLKPCVE